MRSNCFMFMYVALAFWLGGCKQHKENKVEPDHGFVRYVDSETLASDVVPIDMVRTLDNGFLIMGSSPRAEKGYHQIYVLKIDAEGKFLWDYYLPNEFLNPVSDLLDINGSYHLFCMDELAGTLLVRLDETNKSATLLRAWSNLLAPLHASSTPDGGFLILNAHLGDTYTGLTKLNRSLGTEWSEQYLFEEIYSSVIDRHVKKETVPLPFLTGTVVAASQTIAFYFSGLVESNFSTVFVNPLDGKIGGYVQIDGDRSFATVNTVLPLGGNDFAFSHHDRTNTNFLVPRYTLRLQDPVVKASSQLGGKQFPEMEVGARIVCQKFVLAGRDALLYATTTRGKGVVVYAYEAGSGQFLGSKLFSLETPLDIGDLVPTSDGGLMVMAKTYIANRFPRICLFKMSAEEVKRLVVM